MPFRKMEIIFDPKIFTSRIKFSKNQNFVMGLFLKVDLGSKASDYQDKLYGTRREAEKSTK